MFWPTGRAFWHRAPCNSIYVYTLTTLARLCSWTLSKHTDGELLVVVPSRARISRRDSIGWWRMPRTGYSSSRRDCYFRNIVSIHQTCQALVPKRALFMQIFHPRKLGESCFITQDFFGCSASGIIGYYPTSSFWGRECSNY